MGDEGSVLLRGPKRVYNYRWKTYQCATHIETQEAGVVATSGVGGWLKIHRLIPPNKHINILPNKQNKQAV